MKEQNFPLQELSVGELYGEENTLYEIPIYQRNYAWTEDEIAALVQDVYDACQKQMKRYYIGTLVVFHRGTNEQNKQVYEVIDGQQRLTTLYLLLLAMDQGGALRSKLTYRARQKSDQTLKHIQNNTDFADETDHGIENGFAAAKKSWQRIVGPEMHDRVILYFLEQVHIVRYSVPRDVDLNHYFEVMNSRGEQLEKHEIVKADLMGKLDSPADRLAFSRLWDACSYMGEYIQQTLGEKDAEKLFGENWCQFCVQSFADYAAKVSVAEKAEERLSLEDILKSGMDQPEETDRKALPSFQPLIDFPNFLLLVLKITRCLNTPKLSPEDKFVLDDKELLRQFDVLQSPEQVRAFAYNLLKTKFFLDNYVVHHSTEKDEEETEKNNPWKLQVRRYRDKRASSINLLSEGEDGEAESREQEELRQLLSMFEVSFTAHQRKNYLFYILLWLLKQSCEQAVPEPAKAPFIDAYPQFVRSLAKKYFIDVYMDKRCLSDINVPLPDSFDGTILSVASDELLNVKTETKRTVEEFTAIYGDGTMASRGIPLFVFNYLDYLLWQRYSTTLKGGKAREDDADRRAFFAVLGCGDFGLDVFKFFFFSRTRRSLEHYYPQANVPASGHPTVDEINCFGNYAMIGSKTNSVGSNWAPSRKVQMYADDKISRVSVASLKFKIMQTICAANGDWTFSEIQEHQRKMVQVLLEE